MKSTGILTKSLLAVCLTTFFLSGEIQAQEELTQEQDEAVSDLKGDLREGMQTILDVRAKRKPDDWSIRNLVEEVERDLKACADSKVSNAIAFEITDYNDANQKKYKFTIAQVKAELPSWKAAAAQQKSEAAKKESDAQAAKATDEYREIAGDFMYMYNAHSDLFSDTFIKQVQSGDADALSQLEELGELRIPTPMDLRKGFQKCLDAKIPDGFVFDFENGKKYTMGQLKTLVPKWASIGEAAVAKANPSLADELMPEKQRGAKTSFSNAYLNAMSDLEDLKQGNTKGDLVYYQRYSIDPLKKALASAKASGLPSTAMIDTNSEPVTFAVASKKAETFEADLKKAFAQKDDQSAVFRNTQGPENMKRYEAFRAKYISGLSGDKLKVMEDILISNGLYSNEGPAFLDQWYDEGKKPIRTPQDFQKAKIWATTNYAYTNTDVLKQDPHWRVDAYHFDGMSLVNKTTTRGAGTSAPASEFKFKPK
jgi:hypothetical protein